MRKVEIKCRLRATVLNIQSINKVQVYLKIESLDFEWTLPIYTKIKQRWVRGHHHNNKK